MATTTVTIRRGLRRLDFVPPRAGARGGQSTHVVVEFAREDKLAHDQVVAINLGLRDGVQRILNGLPRLVDTKKMDAKKAEYIYRLEGDVA